MVYRLSPDPTLSDAFKPAAALIGGGIQQKLQQFYDEKKEAKQQEEAKKFFEQMDPEASVMEQLQSIVQAPLSDKSKELMFKGIASQQQAQQKQKQQEMINQLLGLGGAPESGAGRRAVPGEGVEEVAVEEEIRPEPAGIKSPEEISAAMLVNPNLGKMYQTQREAHVKREYDRAKPVLLKADERAEALPQKELALESMMDAIKEGDLGFFSKDNLAELTGIEGLRTAKGAQFIASSKEYFLGSLKRAGARPNQWIEQQIQKMLPKVGRSKEANMTVAQMLKSEMAIERANSDILERLSNEDIQKYGYVRGDLGSRASKELKKFAENEQKGLEKRLRSIAGEPKASKGTVLMRDPNGKLREIPAKQVNDARKAGYQRT